MARQGWGESRTAGGGSDQHTAERGLVNLGVALVCGIFTLVVLVGLVSLSIASTSAQGNQNAADAAALAGAGAFEAAGESYFAPGFRGSEELSDMVRTSGPCPSQVRQAAATYANRNGGSLESCRIRFWGEVEVTTRMPVPLDGAADGRARAAANWSLDWRNCRFDPTFETPEGGSADTWMDCDGTRFDLRYAGDRFFLHPWGQVKKEIEREVRLVS